jgi:hypothetical protein
MGLLKKHLPHYNKSGDYYDALHDRQPCALERAQQLLETHRRNNRNILSTESNPCTTLAELVKTLRKRSV